MRAQNRLGLLVNNRNFPAAQSATGQGSPSKKIIQVKVTNPSRVGRVEDVVLSVADIRHAFPDFNAAGAIVIMNTASNGDKDLASQVDDLDGDNQPDELAFQIELQPKETRSVTIAYGAREADPAPRADYPKRTNAKFAQHYDGMGWESETTAWRLYFDKRNAIDLWGKRKAGLYLEMFSAPAYKYQEDSPLGRDIYAVGQSLGAGGVGAWVDGRAIPVAEVSNRKWRIISAGPVRSIVEFTYEGWKAGGRTVTLRSRITQWAGERGYEHNVTLDPAEDFPLVAGITRKPGLEELDISPCSFSIWGPQVVKPGTGATESLPNENLGLAIVVPEGHPGCRRDGDLSNYVVQPQLKNGAARWYVMAAWDQESASTVKNAKEFVALVKREMERLAQPATISIDSNSPQAASATGGMASETKAVKYFSAAEVHASFEKGAPLINKDPHGYSVIAGRREKAGESELHDKDTDVIYVVQGSATFVTGGKMVDPKTTSPGEVRGSGIEGGRTQTLSKDDVIVVPAGVPHWFKDVQGTFLYFVVKTQ
jgi:quercetin dioxygenase-like cupin family protein